MNKNTSFEMYESYETFLVYELLLRNGIESHAEQPLDGMNYRADLYVPNGIDELHLNGNTVIEIKNRLSYATANSIQAIFNELGHKYNLLVVYFDISISRVPIISSNNKKLKFISFNELASTLKHKIQNKSQDAYFADKAKKNDWKNIRESTIKQAQKAIALNNNVLFLGAGVSASAQMPKWNDLLKGLMGEAKQLKGSTLEAFKEMNDHVFEECGSSYLIMARYLQTAIKLHDEKADFFELVQNHLYNNNHKSHLFDILTRILKQKKVNEVITYNFDDLLEQNLSDANLKNSIDFTSISKDAEIKGHNTLPIYHVHGIIPQNGPVDNVVFSEEEYHNLYSQAYHWSNIEQLHALSRMHCLFIGLSMNDPNLRRLLDIARRMNRSNEICHYAFLQRKKLEEYCCSSNMTKSCHYVRLSESLIDKKKQKEIYDLNYSVIESIFCNLGVNIIWYENHDELPNLLAQVFGLSDYKEMNNENLISLCKQKIQEIQEIEDKAPKNDSSNNPNFYIKLYWYFENNSKLYMKNIEETRSILHELIGRIPPMDISDPELQTMLDSGHPFNDKLSFAAQTIYNLLEKVVAFLERQS